MRQIAKDDPGMPFLIELFTLHLQFLRSARFVACKSDDKTGNHHFLAMACVLSPCGDILFIHLPEILRSKTSRLGEQ